MVTVLKTVVAQVTVGSNPTPSAIDEAIRLGAECFARFRSIANALVKALTLG